VCVCVCVLCRRGCGRKRKGTPVKVFVTHIEEESVPEHSFSPGVCYSCMPYSVCVCVCERESVTYFCVCVCVCVHAPRDEVMTCVCVCVSLHFYVIFFILTVALLSGDRKEVAENKQSMLDGPFYNTEPAPHYW